MHHPHPDGKTPTYKLRYFDLRGLGEGARLLFHYAGVPFEDERLSKNEWETFKPSLNFQAIFTVV